MGYNRQQYTMKKYFLISFLSIFLFSCTQENDVVIAPEEKQSEVGKVMDVLYAQNFSTMEEAAAFLGVNFEENTPQMSSDLLSESKDDTYEFSREGLRVIGEIENFVITDDMTLKGYASALYSILWESSIDPESDEYVVIETGIEATIAVLMYDLHLQGYDDGDVYQLQISWFRAAKCALSVGFGAVRGAVIGFGTGGYGGAAVGAVTGAVGGLRGC
jgi:hypothetical protein